MESLNQIEAWVLIWVQDTIRTELLDKIMIFLSAINNAGLIAILTVLLLLIWSRYRQVGIAAVASLATEFILVNVFLKNVVQRIRPYIVKEELTLLGDMPGDYSFPSGHTGSAFAVAIVIYLCMPRKYGIPALLLATLIAISRIYNGAHYPTDVFGAVMVATVTGVLAWKYVFPVACRCLQKMGDTQKE
ncbi:MAG: phosphatase PAP2 family protein [Lachnospiraceae bacterium]|nr:phosphatase PAP2 family protein [Lachnospiraceae bacterium]